MKKTLSIVLGIMIVLSALTGCGNEETASTEPTPRSAEAYIHAPGQVFTFNSTDLEGNPVDESMFEGYDLVLVNLWEAWCSACVEEMPDLERIYKEYDGRVLIVGVANAHPEEGFSTEEKIEETGITYPVINYSDDFAPYDNETSRPVSFFVGSDGRVLPVSMDEMNEDSRYYFEEEIKACKDGYYDEFMDDPATVERVKTLKSYDRNHKKLLKAAQEWSEGSLGSLGEIVSTMSYDSWKYFVDNRLNAIDAANN